MADFTIIKSIDEAIVELLVNKFSTLNPVPSVTNESPANMTINDGEQGLSVYLYMVHENSHMKNMTREKIDSSNIKRKALFLDLFYMLTPYANNRTDEHIILGRAMQVLHDKSILKSTDPEVAATSFFGLDEELHITFQPMSIDDLTKIWGTIKDGTYKLSACYKVTVAKIDSELSDEIIRVREKQIEYYTARGSTNRELV